VNGDGTPDVVTADYVPDAITVLLNANGSSETPDFTVIASTTSATVRAGSAGTYNLTVTGKNGYESAVSFACSGLPAKAACSFSPSSVTTAGNDPQATVLTISTTEPKTTTTSFLVEPEGRHPGSKSHLLMASFGWLGLFGVVLAGNRKRRLPVMLGVLMVAMTFPLVGCSGSDSSTAATTFAVPGTPAGTYTLTVTSTGAGSGKLTHTMHLTLVVQ
jgi:hypothetical protein